VRSRWYSLGWLPLISPCGIRLTVSFARSKRLQQPFLYASVFFFLHFCKVACRATSALHVVLNWLTFRFVGSFFFGPTPKLLISKWLPHYREDEISGPSLRFKGEKFGYVSN